MSISDKFENAKDEVVGRAKEAWGDATDNRSLEAEGEAQQAEAAAGRAAEHVKDAAHEAKEGVKDVFN